MDSTLEEQLAKNQDNASQDDRSLSAYELANSALFRRPAMDVEGPAFIRHVAYWPSAPFHPLGAYDAHVSNLRALLWFAHINLLIESIVGEKDAILVYRDESDGVRVRPVDRKDAKSARDSPAKLLEEIGRNGLRLDQHLLTPADLRHYSDTYLSPSFCGDGWRFRLRADIHIEYFTLTFVLDRPAWIDEPSNRESGLASYMRKTLNPQFTAKLSDELFKDAMAALSGQDAQQAAARDLFLASSEQNGSGKDGAFELVWELLDEVGVLETPQARKELLKASGTERSDVEGDLLANKSLFSPEAIAVPEEESEIIGERFADFRSYGVQLKADAPAERSTDDDDDLKFLGSPVRYRNDLPGGGVEDNADLAMRPHARYLAENEDALRVALRIAPHPGSEVALTGLVDGRALYLSSLGRDGHLQRVDPKTGRPIRDPASTLVQPLRYILTYSGEFPFQRGRVIRMLHEAGVLRIMALRDLRHVRYASQILRQLGQQLAEDSSENSSSENLRAAYTKYLKASRGSAGELGYRTARSQHYVAHWQQAVNELRQRRVEGWQMYDEFIRRRQGSTFDFISRVGSRNATVIEQFETAFAARHAQKAASLALVAAWVGLPTGPLTVNHVFREVFALPPPTAAAFALLAAALYVCGFWKTLLGDQVDFRLRSLGNWISLRPLGNRVWSLAVVIPLLTLAFLVAPVFSNWRCAANIACKSSPAVSVTPHDSLYLRK